MLPSTLALAVPWEWSKRRQRAGRYSLPPRMREQLVANDAWRRRAVATQWSALISWGRSCAILVRNIAAVTQTSGHASSEQNHDDELHDQSFAPARVRRTTRACAWAVFRYSGSPP